MKFSNRLSVLVLISACFAGMSLSAGTDTTDFVSDSHANTNLWDMGATEVDGNGRKFADGGETVTGPLLEGAAVRVSVSAKMFGSGIAGSGSALVIEGLSPDETEWREVHRIEFTGGSATNEIFSVARQENIRRFRLVFVKGNGTLRVGFFKVEWRADGEVAVPSGPAAGNVTDGSFRAVWSVDEPVDGFLFDCWTVSMSRWKGEEKWTENFSPALNGSGNPKLLDGDGIDDYTDNPGWSGEWVYSPAESEGVLQIGKASSETGWLVSPVLPAMPSVELAIRAKAFKESSDMTMSAGIIRGGVTNTLADFVLDVTFGDFHCAAGEIQEGDRLFFRSFLTKKQRRVMIDSVSLVEGFEAGVPVTNVVCDGVAVEYSDAPGFSVEGLAPGETYCFSVRAVSGGNVSAASETCSVTTGSAGGVPDGTDWEGGVASAITHGSFRLDWTALSGAAGYRVSVWTNAVEGASPGTAVWTESFSKAMASESTVAITDQEKFDGNYADNAGWTIVSNVYPSVDAGTVRLGNTSKPGELIAPELNFLSGKALRVRVRRFKTDDGPEFSVWRTAGDTVEMIGDAVELTDAFSEFVRVLPEFSEGERIVLRSASGRASFRTIIDEIAVLEGYAPGTEAPVFAVEAVETDGTSYEVSGLATAVWNCSVEALDGNGAVIRAVTNVVDLVNPPPQPVIDAVPVSEARRLGGTRIWEEDFRSFTNVFASGGNTADWVNGTTLPHWQAYYGGDPVASFTRNHGSGTVKGLYAYWETNKVADTYSLGVMTAGEADDYVFGLAFLNDTDFTVRDIAVGYDGKQFGFRNPEAQELVCECLVTNELVSVGVEGDWRVCEGLTYVTGADASSGLTGGADPPVVTAVAAEHVAAAVPKGSYFILRWRRSAVSYAAAMAIDNLAVTFEIQSRPLVITIR